MFEKKCLTMGIITMLAACFASILPGIYVYMAYGVIPSASEMTSILGMLCASFLVGWIVQPLTFFPAMGVGGTAVSWTTGNVADLRMPAVTAGQKAAEVEPGTPEGDVMATMSSAVSNFVTVAVLTLFTIGGNTLISFLPESVTNAFSYISPAVFGAIIVDYCMKNWKQNLPIIIVGSIVFIILTVFGVSSVWKNLLVLIAGMFVTRAVYKIMNPSRGKSGTKSQECRE